jgi:hypothetical protein
MGALDDAIKEYGKQEASKKKANLTRQAAGERMGKQRRVEQYNHKEDVKKWKSTPHDLRDYGDGPNYSSMAEKHAKEQGAHSKSIHMLIEHHEALSKKQFGDK